MILRTKATRRRRGAAIVETALVLGLFLLILIGIYEYSRVLMVRHLMDNACREGARYAVVHTYDKVTTDVETQVKNFMAKQNVQIQNFKIAVFKADPKTGQNLGDWKDAGFGEAVGVEITGDMTLAAGGLLFLNKSFAVRGRSIMNSEAN